MLLIVGCKFYLHLGIPLNLNRVPYNLRAALLRTFQCTHKEDNYVCLNLVNKHTALVKFPITQIIHYPPWWAWTC